MLDITTIGGFILALAILYFGIVADGELSLFLNAPAIVMVLGGTLVATLINTPAKMLPSLMRAFAKLFVEPKVESMADTIKKMVVYSEKALTSGIDSLTDTEEFKKEAVFLKNGLIMLSDGRSEAFIREVLYSHIKETSARHKMISDTCITAGTFAPTFGLLGTVMGIIQVLKNITNPGMVGNSMALALLTVFYGIVLANFVFIPLGGKMRFRSNLEVKYKQLIIEGVLCIHRGLLPIMVEQRLKAFLQESQS